MHMRLAPLLLLLVCLAGNAHADSPASQPATTQSATTLPAWNRTKDVIYARTAGTALTFDVFTPTTGTPNGAAVIVVVSGGWVSSHDALNSPLVGLFIGPFIRHGYTVFGVVPASQPKFTIPEIADHVDKSVKFIRAHADRFQIDGDKLGIVGGSAGGHLSLLQATKPSAGKKLNLDAVERVSGRVQAAAVLFPPTDFLNYRHDNRNVMDDPLIEPFHAAFDFREMSKEKHKLVEVSRRRQARHHRRLGRRAPLAPPGDPALAGDEAQPRRRRARLRQRAGGDGLLSAHGLSQLPPRQPQRHGRPAHRPLPRRL